MSGTGYGSPLFVGVRRVAQECREVEGRGLAATWRRLRIGVLWIAWYRLRVPPVEIVLTTEPPGRAIWEHLAVREKGLYKFRASQGFLRLPGTAAEYLRGRHRQAVRTTVGHARRMGLTVSETVGDWVPRKVDCRAPFIGPSPVERWMVLDPDGTVVADSILSVDERVALLHGLVAYRTHARWLLHTAIVERLCGHCAVLLTNSDDAYELTPGTIPFQRLLGYEIGRLRPRRERFRVRPQIESVPAGPARLAPLAEELHGGTAESVG